MFVVKLVSAVDEEMELPVGSIGCMPKKQVQKVSTLKQNKCRLLFWHGSHGKLVSSGSNEQAEDAEHNPDQLHVRRHSVHRYSTPVYKTVVLDCFQTVGGNRHSQTELTHTERT